MKRQENFSWLRRRCQWRYCHLSTLTDYRVMPPDFQSIFALIGQNERFVRAYEDAVKSKGGDALIDPVIKESWFWGYILNGYTAEITGTVIKYK